MCESTLWAKKYLKSAITTIIIVAIKEFLLIFKKSTIKMNNKMCRYHGTIANIFIKGKRACFNICIANKNFKYVTIKGKKSSNLMPKANWAIPCSLNSKLFLRYIFLQFSTIQAQRGCIQKLTLYYSET